MSLDSTSSQADAAVIIQNYAKSVHTVYLYLMMATVFGTLLLPFLGVLVYFSTAKQWRSPMFLCVFASVVFALAQMVNQMVIELLVLYDPLGASTVFSNAGVNVTILLDGLPNFCADLALMCRMLVVYPLSSTPRSTFVATFAPLAAFKIGRVVCTLVFMTYYDRNPADAVGVALSGTERAWLITNQTLAALDNVYATAFFLWRLRGAVHPKSDLGRVTSSGSGALGNRLQHLFWISVTNFVLPAPFYLVGVVLTITNAGLAYALLAYVNSFVSVVCVAFATVWSSSAAFQHSARGGAAWSGSGNPAKTRQIRFGHASEASTSTDDIGSSTPSAPKERPAYPLAVRVDWTQDVARDTGSIV